MLDKEQEDAVRKQVIERYGEESVKRMDLFYMEMNDLRMSAETSYDFLDKVKQKYPEGDTDLLLAGILYGMKLGELGVMYHLEQEKQKAEAAVKEEDKKKAADAEEEAKKKKLEAEWEAADKRRAQEAAELFYQ
jgi:hypothetical protein